MKTSDRRGSESSTTVLIVDDEADIRELLELSIIRMGFAVASVGSVRDAQAIIDSRDFNYA